MDTATGIPSCRPRSGVSSVRGATHGGQRSRAMVHDATTVGARCREGCRSARKTLLPLCFIVFYCSMIVTVSSLTQEWYVATFVWSILLTLPYSSLLLRNKRRLETQLPVYVCFFFIIILVRIPSRNHRVCSPFSAKI